MVSRCLLTAAMLVALTTGCGAPRDPGGHDGADAAFAAAMVAHHAQAVAMARLADAHHAGRPVREIAQQISAEQVPEIVQMQELLAGWGLPAAPTDPHTMAATMPGMTMPDMASAGMPGGGMMTDAEMRALGTADGPAFDGLFLPMMIRHHGGGVAMADTELVNGQNGDALLLAQNIRDAQQAEITIMMRLSRS